MCYKSSFLLFSYLVPLWQQPVVDDTADLIGFVTINGVHTFKIPVYRTATVTSYIEYALTHSN